MNWIGFITQFFFQLAVSAIALGFAVYAFALRRDRDRWRRRVECAEPLVGTWRDCAIELKKQRDKADKKAEWLAEKQAELCVKYIGLGGHVHGRRIDGKLDKDAWLGAAADAVQEASDEAQTS